MKINIVYDIVEHPYGGANQFLRNIKNKFVDWGTYTDNIGDAEIVLFNAHHKIEDVYKHKAAYPDKHFVHRLDGLYKLYNDLSDRRQDLAFLVSNRCANAVIFQSNWARDKHGESGFRFNKPFGVIQNCANEKYFNSDYVKQKADKIRLICTSWSTNKNKGFELYNFLDDNLDFSKYSFSYVGKDPGITFKNIIKHGPVTTELLSNFIKENDIFITASKNDCCSNSLLEAMSCNLPAIALNSGGNPEIVKQGGLLFEGKEDVIEKIEEVANNLNKFQDKIDVMTTDEVAKKYMTFFEKSKNAQS